jgi:hypothetical protein
MADDDFIVRVHDQTFADDSFKVLDPRGLVVVAQLPHWVGLTWHSELAKTCGSELKWARVRHRWDDLSPDLRRAAMRDLREALISIVDPSLYRFDLKNLMINAVRQPEAAWPMPFRDWAEAELAKWEAQEILADSPATRIERYLKMPDLFIGDGSREKEDDDAQSVVDLFDDAFQKPHNARVFGARSGAAFAHFLDRDEWVEIIEDVVRDMRYVTPQYIARRVLARGEVTQRVFDEGNAPSVLAIREIKGAIRDDLEEAGVILLPDDLPEGAVEASSASVIMLQAADLAAGYAKDLYLSDSGIRGVCEEFNGVILNGSMVRDWSQVDRADLGRLRARK